MEKDAEYRWSYFMIWVSVCLGSGFDVNVGNGVHGDMFRTNVETLV